MTCENCGTEFDPIASRWLCPKCGYKANCCEGEPQNAQTDFFTWLAENLED